MRAISYVHILNRFKNFRKSMVGVKILFFRLYLRKENSNRKPDEILGDYISITFLHTIGTTR